MADKLDWLNEHFVLLKHMDVNDVVANENYKIPFELQNLALNCKTAEDYIKKLAVDKKYKQSNEFLSYAIHQRALAWWGYCCVLSLIEELKQNPHKPRDIEDIGKPKPFDIPEWAQMQEALDPEKPIEQIKLEEIISKKDEMVASLWEKVPKDIKELHDEIYGIFMDEFINQFGKTPQEAIDEALDLLRNMSEDDDLKHLEQSPIFKAEKELKEKIETMRKETVEKIKQAIPKKSHEELDLQTKNALNATYAYIVAPNDVNAKQCMDLGNLCPDTPEGLLSLVAFWSYGNLMPNSNQVVKTPGGLAANGFNSLLMMLAVKEGGTRKFNERMELYFNLGKDVAFGKNNWAEYVASRTMPHEADESVIKKITTPSSEQTVTSQSQSNTNASTPIEEKQDTNKFQRFEAK